MARFRLLTAAASLLRITLGQTTAAGTVARGAIQLDTAQRFGATSPPLVLQYFALAFDGTAFSGTLVEDHREESAAANLLSHAVELVACRPSLGVFNNQSAIAEGARISGTITDQAVRLHVEGNTTETTRPFVADIAAVRSG